MIAANTEDCFRICIGKCVIGVLFNSLPLGNHDVQRGTKTLIFDDGTGLTFCPNGTFCIESEGDMRQAISKAHALLARLHQDIEECGD